MNKKFFAVFLPILAGILFSGCASMGVPGDDDVQAALELISGGDSALLQKSSRLPFLLDSEILLGESEVSLLWRGLAEGGFVFHNPVIEDVFPANPEIYTLFGDSMDVEVFFRKYLTPRDSIIRFQSDEGVFLLILSSRKTGRKIVGLSGGM